jgi:hypothetical protein
MAASPQYSVIVVPWEGGMLPWGVPMNPKNKHDPSALNTFMAANPSAKIVDFSHMGPDNYHMCVLVQF